VAGAGLWFLYLKGSSEISTPASDIWPRTVADLNKWYGEPPEDQLSCAGAEPTVVFKVAR
jgi:hypothetical protein